MSTPDTPQSPAISPAWTHVLDDKTPPGMTLRQRVQNAGKIAAPVPNVLITKRNVAAPGATPSKGTGPELELLTRLGEGGRGIVYAARQTSVNRTVAVKFMRSDLPRDEAHRNVFLSEAVITADLEHPNIVPVHDLGETLEGTLFYSMKRITGTPWSEVMDGKPLSENLSILLAVSDAVSFAHSKGIIHRDLKPDNVMLGEYGEVLLMDWGLAVPVTGPNRTIAAESGAGGTPAYMPPEMARALADRIGFASDIYLLGGILHRIVTGVAPHGGSNVTEAMLAAIENRIDGCDRSDEMLDIRLKAMAAEPEKRYASVKEFQAAIREHLAHSESLRLSHQAAKRLQLAEQSKQYEDYARALFVFQEAQALWPGNTEAKHGENAARLAYARCAFGKEDLDLAASLPLPDDPAHRELVYQVELARQKRDARQKQIRAFMAACLALTALILVTLTVAFLWIRSEQARTEAAGSRAEAQRDKAVASEILARKEQEKTLREDYFATIPLAHSKIEAGNVVEAEDLLRRCPVELRNWEWGCLKRLCHQELLTFKGHEEGVTSVAWSPDGSWVASGALDGTVRIWNPVDGIEVKRLPVPKSGPTGAEINGVRALAFSPDGGQLAAACSGGELAVWDLRAGNEAFTMTAKPGPILCVAYSSDGARIASNIHEKDIIIRDAKTGEPVRLLQGHTERVAALAFSPDGRTLASGGYDDKVRVWTTETGEQILKLEPGSVILSVAYDSEGKRIVTGDAGGGIRVWDAASGRMLMRLNTQMGEVAGVAFSPDGKRIAAAVYDVVTVWDAGTGDELFALKGHQALVKCVAFRPDGRRILSGSMDKTVKLWDAENPGESRVLWKDDHELPWTGPYAVAFSPDGERLAAGVEGAVLLLDPADRGRMTKLAGCEGGVTKVAFSPDGSLVAGATDDATVKVWETRTGRMALDLKLPKSAVGVSFSPDGKFLATAGADGIARLWELPSGREFRVLKSENEAGAQAAFSPDGTCVALGNTLNAKEICLAVLDLATGREISRLAGKPGKMSAFRVLRFSPRGHRLIIGDAAGRVIVWDADAGKQICAMTGHRAAISALAVTPDGKRILSGARDSRIIVWDAEEGRELLVLKEPSGRLWDLAFSPDGRTLASASNEDRTVRLRETAPWAAQAK